MAEMTGSAGAAGPASDAASHGSIDPGSLSSSSWVNTADVEIQRELIASRLFDSGPLTIDRFEIDKLVGAGASAAVYAARDPLLGRRVALKILGRARDGRVGVANERLIREARALADLSHPNVVTIHEVGQWNDHPFIAMELIEGATLAQWLGARRRSAAEILAVFREAGRGLAAAHARGHVHRDFKPANVLVAHDGRVVVSDFGLVDDVTDDAESRASAGGDDRAPRRRPVGTPAYVAPEQRAGAAAHPSADVYSFALALIEAVLGYHPMPESNARWRSALRARVPRRICRELCAAMALLPQQRSQSLGPLLDALSPRRHGRQRVVGALVVGITGAIIALALARSRQDRTSSPPHESARPLLQPLLPSEIFKEANALRETPPDGRDDHWSARARTVLMLPIPTRVPCDWPSPPRTLAIIGDEVVALDLQDRVMSCGIRTGTVRVIARNVICIRPVGDAVLGVASRDHKIAVYHHRGAAWLPVLLADPAMVDSADTGRNPRCSFSVSAQEIVPPRILLPWQPASPEADNVLLSGGGRTILRRADSLWLQAGDMPPKRLGSGRTGAFRADHDLHYAVIATPASLQVVDLTTTSVVASVPGPNFNDISMDISPDGSVAAAAGLYGPLLWWRRGDRQWHTQALETDTVAEMKLSRQGERVLLRSGLGRLEIRELTSGRRYPLADAQIETARFLGEDHVVAVDGSGGLWRWSLTRLRSWVLADHGGDAWMWGFTTCGSGSSVLTATNRKDRPILISSPSGAPQVVLDKPPDAQIYSLACSGDRILAGTRDGNLLEWEWPTGRKLADHDVGVRSWIWTMATVQPVGGARIDLIGTGQTRSRLGGGQVMALRNAALTPIFTANYGSNTGIDDIVASSNGRYAVVAASSGELALIDTISATAISHVQAHGGGETRHVRFLQGDRSVVTAGDDGYLRIWRVPDLQLERQIHVGHGAIYEIDVHGTTVLVGTSDGHLGAWGLTSERLLRAYDGHGAGLAKIRFDASGHWIGSGDFDGSVCVHRSDLESCYAALVGHKRARAIRHVRFLADGQIITASEDGTVRQWDPPYTASSSELACELQGYLFQPEAGGIIDRRPGCTGGVVVYSRVAH